MVPRIVEKQISKMLSKRLSSMAIFYSRATSKNLIGAFVSGIKCLGESIFITSCSITLANGMFLETRYTCGLYRIL